MRNKVLLIYYFLLTIFFVIAKFYDCFILSLIFKTSIIPLLVIFFITNIKNIKPKILIPTGLILSWFGDIGLQFQSINQIFFLVGLGFFLITHILYIINFSKEINIKDKFFIKILFVAFLGILLFLVANKVLASMQKFKLPVIIYAIALFLMVSSTILRKSSNLNSYILVLTGAILFLISDSTISIDKFYHPFVLSVFIVMPTYVVAQFLIVKGVLVSEKSCTV